MSYCTRVFVDPVFLHACVSHLNDATRFLYLYYCWFALYSSKSRRNLLSFKDIHRNGYHIETMNEENVEYLYITSIISGQKLIMEKLPAFSSRLYHTTIKPIESYVVVNQKFNDHDRLGHPGSSMMHRIIEHSHGHPLKN